MTCHPSNSGDHHAGSHSGAAVCGFALPCGASVVAASSAHHPTPHPPPPRLHAPRRRQHAPPGGARLRTAAPRPARGAGGVARGAVREGGGTGAQGALPLRHPAQQEPRPHLHVPRYLSPLLLTEVRRDHAAPLERSFVFSPTAPISPICRTPLERSFVFAHRTHFSHMSHPTFPTSHIFNLVFLKRTASGG